MATNWMVSIFFFWGGGTIQDLGLSEYVWIKLEYPPNKNGNFDASHWNSPVSNSQWRQAVLLSTSQACHLWAHVQQPQGNEYYPILTLNMFPMGCPTFAFHIGNGWEWGLLGLLLMVIMDHFLIPNLKHQEVIIIQIHPGIIKLYINTHVGLMRFSHLHWSITRFTQGWAT